MPTEKLSLYEKINKLRLVLQNEEIKKTGHNKHSNYYYYELKDFMPIILSSEDELGLFSFCDFPMDGPDRYCRLTVVDISTKDSISITSPIAEARMAASSPIQGIGATHTYMRRYMYATFYEINDGDMVDAEAALNEVTQKETDFSKANVILDKLDIEYIANKENTDSIVADVAKICDCNQTEALSYIRTYYVARTKDKQNTDKKSSVKKTNKGE